LSWAGHRSNIQSVAFTTDGKALVSGGADGTVHVWRDLEGTRPQQLATGLGRIYNVALAPGRPVLAASGAEGVEVWDIAAGKLLHKRFEELRTGRAHFFPDGKTLLVAGEWQQTWLWSLDTDKVRRYHEGRVVFIGDGIQASVL